MMDHVANLMTCRLRCRGAGEQRGERGGEPRLLEVGDGLGVLHARSGGAERARTRCAGGGFGVPRLRCKCERGQRGKGEVGGTVRGRLDGGVAPSTVATWRRAARELAPSTPRRQPSSNSTTSVLHRAPGSEGKEMVRLTSSIMHG